MAIWRSMALWSAFRKCATLQQGRDAAVVGSDPAQPSGAKLITSVPDLATMTKGALNYLGKDKDGLFIMIEGEPPTGPPTPTRPVA